MLYNVSRRSQEIFIFTIKLKKGKKKKCQKDAGMVKGTMVVLYWGGGWAGVSKVSELLWVCLPRGALLKPLIFETILHLMNFIFSLFLFIYLFYWRAQWKR
jgi:hypothetical protein